MAIAIASGAAPRRLLVTAALGVLLAGCGSGSNEGGEPPQGPPPPTVSVATVVAKPVTEWDEFNGRIEAIDTITIRPRVAGYLASIHFQEGAEVEAGALLFTIDDREYRAAVASAQANVERALTRVDVAREELDRSERLVEARASSREELAQRRGEFRQAEADVKAAQAQLAQAELQLEFTRIEAPIAGRTGAALVKPGNLVNAGEAVLTTLVSIDPVYVSFEGDERVYLKYQGLARQGLRSSSRDVANPVRVALANEDGFPHEGRMVFVDNALDPATGTIRGRALLDNAHGMFTPGLFARVRLLSREGRDALLVHDQAILTDQDRKFVYVIGEGNAALRRDVTLGPQAEGLRIIEAGLAAGDRVIVNGTRRVFFPGMPVNPVTVAMGTPNADPAAPGAGR